MYGNNCMQIVKFSAHKHPLKLKKHAECFFKHNMKTNSAAVKRYQGSFSFDGKAQVLVRHSAEQQKYQQSLAPKDKTEMLLNNAATHRKQCQSPSPDDKVKNLKKDATTHKRQ